MRSVHVLTPLLALALHARAGLLASPARLSLAVSPAEVLECRGGDVEVSFLVENPDASPIAGFQAFLRYPVEFEPVSYKAKDLSGFTSVNGPSPFGTGFPGCDLP